MSLSRLLLTAFLLPLGVLPGASSPQGSWRWPLAPPHQVTRQFQAPATQYARGHRGIDLAARSGDPVLSPFDGVVSFAGVVVDRPVLSIESVGDVVASFEPVKAGVAAGERVAAGDVVGAVSLGAHCSGTCVHLGVRLHGRYVSPLLYLGGIPRAVLLPLSD